MKKIKIASIFTALFSCLLLMGCPDDKNTDTGTLVNARGKVIILQAYGSSAAAAGVSHSFVELYNTTDEDISLDGIGLYYADGTTVPSGQTNDATEDGAWKRISLDGKTIPAKGSFLILGSKESAAARYQIEENYGDINDENFTLSNRAFKVALIQSTEPLTVQNPFDTDGNGKVISGYIDMVGAANDYEGRDLIFGFETAPARNSASEAVRRTDLMDTDDNRGVSSTFPDADGDFASIRYSLPSDNGISDEELEVRKPRNSSVGDWDPFADPAEPPEPPEPENPTVAGTPSPLAGTLLILQVYGTGTDTDGAVSHSFIELYNNTNSPINLNAYSLQYANTTGTNWTVINLTGTIPAKGSYLVRGNNNNTSGRLQLDTADQDVAFFLDNRNFKVALMANQNKLTVENPFAMTGGKAKDYIDMVGVKNGNNDSIDGYETALAQVISKQAAARRSSLTDSDNNSADFVRIDYRTSGINNELLEVRKPRNSSDGDWDPFEAPAEPPEPPEPENPTVVGTPSPLAGTLLILQVGAATDGAITRSFVELYNNSDSPVNLNTYSIQYANAAGTSWTVINLTGTVPAHGSYLVRGEEKTITGDSRLYIENADQTINDFELSNRNFKVALMANQNKLTVNNPFDMTGRKAADYVDMIGARNGNSDSIDGYETALAQIISKQAAARRSSLTDTDDNSADFERIDYRVKSGNNGISDEELEVRKPRTSSAGNWDPFAEPEYPIVIPTDNKLLILQIGAATDGNISHSFVELYNNGDQAVNLSGYSLQYAEGTRETEAANRPNTNTEDGPWAKIDLTGTIQPKHSFLILGDEGIGQTSSTNPALALTAGSGDMNVSFVISNRSFKVVLLGNTTLLTVQNPFDTDGAGAKASGYVDMVGAMNTVNEDKINGYEGSAITNLNKQTGQRRKTLTDTNDNASDFERAVYSGATSAQVELRRPKNLAHGAWDPVTGESQP